MIWATEGRRVVVVAVAVGAGAGAGAGAGLAAFEAPSFELDVVAGSLGVAAAAAAEGSAEGFGGSVIRMSGRGSGCPKL